MSLLNIFPITMVAIGAIFMVLSIIQAIGLSSRLNAQYKRKWLFLITLKGFFLFAYLVFITVLLMNLQLPLQLLTGPVFMGGGIFVFLIIRLTKITVTSLSDQERAVQYLNDSLEDKVNERTSALEESMTQLAVEVTEREKANKEILQLSQDLSLIMDTISTGFRVIGMDCRVQRVNKSFSRLTGLSSEELIGSNCFENFKGEDCRNSQHCRLSAHKSQSEITSETVVKTTHDGRKLHLHLTSAAMRDSNGTITAVVEDFNDITALVEAQEETALTQGRLYQAAKLESVGQLAAGIAHEINTPVQFISTNMEFLSEGFEDIATFLSHLDARGKNKQISEGLEQADWNFLKEEIPQALEQTTEGIERVRKLVLAMKEFSHPGTVSKAPTDINAILENTTIICQNEWKMVADLEMNLTHDLPLPPCKGDEMGQVFLNIMVNAAQAIGDKVLGTEEKGRIHIKTSASEEYVEITISDTGKGIDEELRGKIFDPFFTTKDTGQGSGLGLFIVHDIIVQHGGQITIENMSRRTLFTIVLPAGEIS